ncbi:MAG: WG repeat-containing protein [Clostridiales Family XIII bacterium]|nr:WG repeat-containing protein [Clostridiales Family XIII bacterium]
MKNLKFTVLVATAVLLPVLAACAPGVEEKEQDRGASEIAKEATEATSDSGAPAEAPDRPRENSDARPGAGGVFRKGDSLVAEDQKAAAGSDYAGMDILWLDFGPDIPNFETFWSNEGEGTFVVFPEVIGENDNAMLIDKNGTVVVDRRYGTIRDFSEGLFSADNPDRYFYIDNEGNVVLTESENLELTGNPFSEGLAPFVVSGSYPDFSHAEGFIDRNGDVIIPARFAEVGFYGFSEGLASAKDAESGLWGFIDRSGEYVIPPSYSKQPGDFHEGLAFAWSDEEFAFIDKSGGTAIPYQRFDEETLAELKTDPEAVHYSEWPGFFNGIACVNGLYFRRDGSVMENLAGRPFREKVTFATDYAAGENVCIDTSGKRMALDGRYSPFAWDTKQDGFILIRDETKDRRQIGMMNVQGRTVVPTMFDFVSEATEGFVLVIPDFEEARIGILRLPENAAELPAQ